MEVVDCRLCILVPVVVDEAETLVFALVVDLDECRSDLTISSEQSRKVVLGGIEWNILDVKIGKLGFLLIDLGLAFLLGIE